MLVGKEYGDTIPLTLKIEGLPLCQLAPSGLIQDSDIHYPNLRCKHQIGNSKNSQDR
jgi:hypothetical protein